MASNHSNIGRTIREKRLALGLTQVELANMLHITQGTLAQYENGKRNPKVAMVQRFADAFGEPWMDLYEDNVELNCALKEDFCSRHETSETEQHLNLPVDMENLSNILLKDAPFPPDDKRSSLLLDFDKLNATGREIALQSATTLLRNQFKGDIGRQFFIFLLLNMDHKANSILANLLVELPYIPHLNLSGPKPDSSSCDSEF